MFAFSQWSYIDLPSAWYLLLSHPLKGCYLSRHFLSQSHSVGCYYENVMLDINSCSICLLFPSASPVYFELLAIQYTCSSPYFLKCRFNKAVYSIVQIMSENTEWSWKWCSYPWNIHLNASFLFDRELDNYPLETVSDGFCSHRIVVWSNLCFCTLLTRLSC